MTPFLYWKLSRFYYLYYFFVGIFVPYWALYLTSLNFSPIQIGTLLAIFQFGRIISPNFWAYLADQSSNRTKFLRLNAFIGALGFIYIYFAHSFYDVLIVMLFMSLFTSSTLPLFESITLSHLSEGKGEYSYSKIRVWGSFGFICSSLAVGFLVDRIGISVAIVAILITQILIFTSSIKVPEKKIEIIDNQRRSIFLILKKLNVMAVILGCTLMVSSHGLLYNFYSIFLEQNHYSKTIIGILWSIGVICEIFIFLLFPKIMKFVSLKQLIFISLVLAVIRFFLIGQYIDNLFIIFLAQTLHAATFGCFHVASVQVIEYFFNKEHHARGQSIYNSITYGLGGVIGGLGGGFLIDRIGMNLTFTLSALLPLIAIFIFRLGLRNYPD